MAISDDTIICATSVIPANASSLLNLLRAYATCPVNIGALRGILAADVQEARHSPFLQPIMHHHATLYNQLDAWIATGVQDGAIRCHAAEGEDDFAEDCLAPDQFVIRANPEIITTGPNDEQTP